MTNTVENEDDSDFAQAIKAFMLFTNEERRRALHVFAGLRYPSLDDRFFEAVYRIVTRRDEHEAGESPNTVLS